MSFTSSSLVRRALDTAGNAITSTMDSTTPTRALNNVIGKRVGNIILGASKFTTRTVDTGIGILLAIPAIFNVQFFTTHIHFINQSAYILSDPFECFVKTINPNADFNGSTNPIRTFENVNTICKDVVRDARNSNSMVVKHVISRLLCVLAPIALTISSLSQGIFGLGAAVLAIGTAGIFPKVNFAASQGLQFTKLFKDVSYFAIKVINPWAGLVFIDTESLTPIRSTAMMFNNPNR